MQASLALPGSLDLSNRYPYGEFDEFSKLTQEFSTKVHVRYYVTIDEEEEKQELKPEDEDRVEEGEGEEEEFSFACSNSDGSTISAEEVFQDGQIRPVYPIFDQNLLYALVDSNNEGTSTSSPRPPLKKLFVEEHDRPSSSETDELDGTVVGPYCEWSRKVVEASPERACKKSNSTGSSKIWRFRDLVHRSSSDGKDAFVFLSSRPVTSKKSEKVVAKEVKRTATGEKAAKKPTVSAHELHYVKNRAMREEDRRRSYLPYRQGVVGIGFFSSVNGLTKNVHPY